MIFIDREWGLNSSPLSAGLGVDVALHPAWDQWAQLGVSAPSRRSDRWAADPEALLLFTLEVARADARLFDEVLDWVALNERLVSVQRLRNLSREDVDRSLADAALAWAAESRRRMRPKPAVE